MKILSAENQELSRNQRSFLDRIIRKVGRAINRYGLISDGDRVAVGISGGKDSLVLLETLSLRRKHIPIDYDLFAIHINIENIPFEINRDFVAEFCAHHSISFHERIGEIGEYTKKKKSTCFTCSWNRRKELFLAAGRLGCNRVALGHHMDDMVETLLLNMVFNASYGTMPPRLAMFDGEFDIIRPLALCEEREVEKYAEIRGFQTVKRECPFGDKTRRQDMKKIIAELEKLNRKAKKNLYWAMSNIHEGYLPREEKDNENSEDG